MTTKENNRIWFWANVLVIVAAIALLAIILGTKKHVAPLVAQKQTNNMLSAADAALENSAAAVIKSADIASCAQFAGKSVAGTDYGVVCKNNIAMNLAAKNLDISYCSQLDGKLMSITDCQSRILLQSALKNNTAAACDSAPTSTMKTSCIAGYWLSESAKTNDPKLCANMPDAVSQKSCADGVLINQLVLNPASTTCAIFTTSSSSADCVQYKKTVASHDPIGCTKIASPLLANLCNQSIRFSH